MARKILSVKKGEHLVWDGLAVSAGAFAGGLVFGAPGAIVGSVVGASMFAKTSEVKTVTYAIAGLAVGGFLANLALNAFGIGGQAAGNVAQSSSGVNAQVVY